ncbi:MAG TPA: PocR ligand-binding domain-containing protein [Anaerolineaceae bacterium]|jgi:excisionase family DNA binding protein
MEDNLTTRQIQELLQVDRITIYRMLQDGRLKGVKIGQQWRFPRREVDRLLAGQETAPETARPDASATFPTHCLQTIQDLFSEVSQIGALIVDLQGQPLTQMSHACDFCQAMLASPLGMAACRTCWKDFFVHAAAGSKFFTCFAGLNYVGAPILDRGDVAGMFLVGPFYWQAADPREEAERLRRLADTYALPLESLRSAARSIPVIVPEQQAQIESWPFTAARAVQGILAERTGFMERLRQIANLSQIS